jgi:lysophospholipase L1-like esterase
VSQAAAVAAPAPRHYYVALGDSLSVGYQPGAGDTDQGYVDDLYASLKSRDPGLRLVKLGCSGETTTTMMRGGICHYTGGGQLRDAESFLAAHRGRVRYVTLDIGANDVDKCLAGGAISPSCILGGLGTISTNLPQIVGGIRKAAGPHAPKFAAMTYYDPFLASWLTGSKGHALAGESVVLANVINAMETGIYRASGFRVADVAATYATNDFGHPETLPGTTTTVPRNVARICAWTWMCTQNNIHANATGYQRIADTFTPVLAR